MNPQSPSFTFLHTCTLLKASSQKNLKPGRSADFCFPTLYNTSLTKEATESVICLKRGRERGNFRQWEKTPRINIAEYLATHMQDSMHLLASHRPWVFYRRWLCEVVQTLLSSILLIRETEAQEEYMTCPRSHNLLLSTQNRSPGSLVPG